MSCTMTSPRMLPLEAMALKEVATELPLRRESLPLIVFGCEQKAPQETALLALLAAGRSLQERVVQ